MQNRGGNVFVGLDRIYLSSFNDLHQMFSLFSLWINGNCWDCSQSCLVLGQDL